MWIFAIIIWIVLSILAGVGARNKGRSFAGFFFLSLLLSPLVGLIAMAVVKPIEEEEEEEEEPEQTQSIEQPTPAAKGIEVTCPICGKPKIAGEFCPTCNP